jgi:2-octaprenyl-6-methoxyphenol hydroxylase
MPSSTAPASLTPAQKRATRIAVIGAGPVGLALALAARSALPHASIDVFDARAASQDISADPRAVALSLGSVRLLERLAVWPAGRATPIHEVCVSQDAAAPVVRIRAVDERVPMLGAVIRYGQLVTCMQQAWMHATEQEPQRLRACFGSPVSRLHDVPQGVEVTAADSRVFDLAVVAEGGVFGATAHRAPDTDASAQIEHDYRQTAWVGVATLADAAHSGVAFERFTRHGPVALLPLGADQFALVWCVGSADDPLRELDDAQRIAVLNTTLPEEAGRVTALSPLKAFPLGLKAQRTLVNGRRVMIGNAAQTLHPVAGQGLNLGLRDAHALVHGLRRAAARGEGIDTALRRLEWQRAPDRWAMIAATDFLARSFTWQWPGAAGAMGLGLAVVQAMAPLKSALARQMMFGGR